MSRPLEEPSSEREWSHSSDRNRENNGDWNPNRDRDRGQLVLIAAIALAVALVPLVLAYVQLGYHDDIHAGSPTVSDGEVERALEHALHNASTDIAGTYEWSERDVAANTVYQRLAPSLDSINRSALDGGTVVLSSLNATHAQQWQETNCPAGPNREFGPCEVSEGVVLQERSGNTHVLAVAFDVSISTPNRDVQFTTVVERD